MLLFNASVNVFSYKIITQTSNDRIKFTGDILTTKIIKTNDNYEKIEINSQRFRVQRVINKIDICKRYHVTASNYVFNECEYQLN